MKDLNKEIAAMMTDAVRRLAQLAANASFDFWQRKDFRLYVEFGNISRTEQDRVFNELEVSMLGLFILYFDNAKLELEEPERMVLAVFQRELTPAFLKIMEDIGIQKVYLKQWETLIDMRLKEYREDYKIALRESKKEKDLKDDRHMAMSWAAIETITIDCLSHIRRGDVKEKDPLWNLLRIWLTMHYAQLSPMTQLAENAKKN